MSQELNADELATDLHRLSGAPALVAGVLHHGRHPRVQLGVAGVSTHDAEAIAVALLGSMLAALDASASPHVGVAAQRVRIAAAIDALRPILTVETESGEVH